MIEAPANSIHPESRAAWRAWLEKHHTRKEGIWLITDKKASGRRRLTYAEAVEEALCFGWIDSKPGKLDAHRSMLWLAPRKPRSRWSRANRDRVARMIEAGLMAPAGLAKVEAAKRDGAWNALDAVESMEIPPDLAEELARYENARDHFEAFPPSAKRAILDWISTAKRQETRARRVEETARCAAKNVRANQWRPSLSADSF